MYDELLNQNIIVELNNLVELAEKGDTELDSYAEFMKGMILNTYGIN